MTIPSAGKMLMDTSMAAYGKNNVATSPPVRQDRPLFHPKDPGSR